MKANELMLRDWVYHRDENEPGQVYELREDFIEIDVNLPKEGQACWIDGDPEEFEGIPLTENMLLENGWDKYPFLKSFANKNVPEFHLSGTDNWFYSANSNGAIVDVYYVHELQHLLRIFGHCDLADSFKIK